MWFKYHVLLYHFCKWNLRLNVHIFLVICWLLLITEFLVFQNWFALHAKETSYKQEFLLSYILKHFSWLLKLAPFNVLRLTRRELHKKIQVRLIFENVPVSEKYVLWVPLPSWCAWACGFVSSIPCREKMTIDIIDRIQE